MDKENKGYGWPILGIVAIVAVVGLVMLFAQKTTVASEEAAAGEAAKASKLTTAEKMDILDMLRAKCIVSSFKPGDNCINLCNNLGINFQPTNIGGWCLNAYEGRKFTVGNQTIFQVTPVSCDYQNNWDGYIACNCCKP